MGIRLNMTEKLFTGTLNHNQNKKKPNGKIRKLMDQQSGCLMGRSANCLPHKDTSKLVASWVN